MHLHSRSASRCKVTAHHTDLLTQSAPEIHTQGRNVDKSVSAPYHCHHPTSLHIFSLALQYPRSPYACRYYEPGLRRLLCGYSSDSAQPGTIDSASRNFYACVQNVPKVSRHRVHLELQYLRASTASMSNISFHE